MADLWEKSCRSDFLMQRLIPYLRTSRKTTVSSIINWYWSIKVYSLWKKQNSRWCTPLLFMTDTNTASFSELIILLLPTKVTHVGLLFRVQKFQFNYHLITKFDGKVTLMHKSQKWTRIWKAIWCNVLWEENYSKSDTSSKFLVHWS